MTYVVDERCIKCKTTDCVDVCPVDCFYEGENMLVIHPGEFIVIPRGVEHLPSADEETHIMLLEPKTTLNTGNIQNERTLAELERI